MLGSIKYLNSSNRHLFGKAKVTTVADATQQIALASGRPQLSGIAFKSQLPRLVAVISRLVIYVRGKKKKTQ